MYKWEEAGFNTQIEWLDYLIETEGEPTDEDIIEGFYANRERIDIGIYDENDRLIGIKPEEDEDWALPYKLEY